MVAGSEKMLGAMLSNAGFKCCVCTNSHRHLNGGQPSEECFYSLVREAGGEAPYSGRGRRRRSYNTNATPTKSWSPQSLSRVLWPAQFPEIRKLDLAEFKHALAADNKDAGLEFLKSVIEEWTQRNWRDEQEAWLTSAAPVDVTMESTHYGLTLISTASGAVAGLNAVKTATLLMKDASVGRLLSTIASSSTCVSFEWLDVTKPAKLLLNIKGGVDKEDATGVYLFTQQNRLQFIPKMVKSIAEAEEALKQDLLTKLSSKL